MAAFLRRISRALRPRPDSRREAVVRPHALAPPALFSYLTAPRSQLDQGLLLGHRLADGSPCRLAAKSRAAHLYCAGVTGSGKSRFLTHLVCNEIALGRPVVLLDPFGGLYRAVQEFVTSGLEEAMAAGFDGDALLERYRFLDLDADTPLQVNPLAPHPLETVEHQIDDLMRALERLFGTSLQEQRRLRNVLRNVFALVADLNRLPVERLPPYLRAQAPFTVPFAAALLQLTDEQRLLLLNLVRHERPDAFRRPYWQFFAGLGSYERNQMVQSTFNVFQYLLGDAQVTRFFEAQTTLDLPGLLRQGQSLFCHLPLSTTLTGAPFIGRFLTTKLQQSAYRRPAAERSPLRLVLDEFHHFSDMAFADALTNLRQFGLFVTCAHQSSQQPPFDTPPGQALLQTIRANCQLKALFRLARPDAEDLARELFELSQQRENFQAIDRTFGHSERHSSSQGTSHSTRSGSSEGSTVSKAYRQQTGDRPEGGPSQTRTNSQQEDLRNVLTTEQGFRQDRSETLTVGRDESETHRIVYYSLEGERELFITQLQRLAPRQFHFTATPLAGELLEAPFVPDQLLGSAPALLPETLLAWQERQVAAARPVVPEETALVVPESPPPALEASEPAFSPPRAPRRLEPEPLEAEVESESVLEEDPFLD